MNAMEISLTGLDVEWRRLEIIAQNIANANTVVDSLGEAYKPLRLLSGPAGAGFSASLDNARNGDLRGVSVYSVEPQNLPPRRVYEPEHPQADAEGYINYPGMSHSAEMTLMVKTARSYEANIVAFNTARQMYSKALDIGRRSA
ncbi:MAG: flagellar basal body rod protein FlgC [Sphingomonadales bacterium]|nr:flagellar basal body rod protein FlgC [Sphingomonadales bacterium]